MRPSAADDFPQMIKRLLIICLLVSPAYSQTNPQRPKIVGVAHIGLRTDGLAAARKFYTGILGFAEPFSLDNPHGLRLVADLFQSKRPSIH